MALLPTEAGDRCVKFLGNRKCASRGVSARYGQRTDYILRSTMTLGTETLEALTRRVRLFTTCQVGRYSFTHTRRPNRSATAWLKRKEAEGLILLTELMLSPMIDVSEPLLDYFPGSASPDFDALAWQTRSRWKLPPQRAIVATATKKAKAFLGGSLGGRNVRIREATHDAHCAEIYLNLLERDSQAAAAWVPEDSISRLETGFVPDAIIQQAETILVEFAGSYSAAKLRTLHARYRTYRYQLY